METTANQTAEYATTKQQQEEKERANAIRVRTATDELVRDPTPRTMLQAKKAIDDFWLAFVASGQTTKAPYDQDTDND